MTSDEALEKHREDCRRCKDKACERNIQCLQKKDIEVYEEVQQYREYREIFESHFTEDALKLFSDKEEFSKWFERGKWHVLKCDELGREVEAYRAIGTVSEFRQLKEKAKKAEWIFDDFTAKFGNPYRCSNCEEEFGDTYNYCPNWGCDMYAD